MHNKNLLRSKVFCNWVVPEKIYTIPMQEISATIQGGGGRNVFRYRKGSRGIIRYNSVQEVTPSKNP